MLYTIDQIISDHIHIHQEKRTLKFQIVLHQEQEKGVMCYLIYILRVQNFTSLNSILIVNKCDVGREEKIYLLGLYSLTSSDGILIWNKSDVGHKRKEEKSGDEESYRKKV